MKVLIIQVGTPVQPADYPGQQLFLEPTVTHGMQYFRYGEVVNNMQTRDSLKGRGIEVDHIYFTGRKSPVNCIKAAIKLRKMANQNQYDIVNQYWGGLSSFFTAFFCPSIYIISFLGSDIYGQYRPDGSRTMMGKMLAFFSQLTGLFASGIIVMSEKMRQKLWTPSRSKAVAICEGISLDKFYPMPLVEARSRLGWRANTPIVLFFPSEAYVKNTPLAKAAFKKLQEQMPDAELKLVQGVPHAELVWQYNAADLLLLTSYHEGSNNSIKEALACNLPVVTVAVGDAAERLAKVTPSAVVDAFDATQLADAMAGILKTRQRSNGSSVVDEVELPNIAVKIIAYYRSLVRSKQGLQS